MKLSVCFLFLLSGVLTGCIFEKEYSVKEVVKAWLEKGPTAPLVMEVRLACAEHQDKGEKGTAVCNVLHQAQAEISSKTLDLGLKGGIRF